MGPLSWLTQLSFVPQSLVAAGATGATAVTAVVGLGAGALGVVLGDDEVFSSTGTELTASPTYLPDDFVDSRRLATGHRRSAVGERRRDAQRRRRRAGRRVDEHDRDPAFDDDDAPHRRRTR